MSTSLLSDLKRIFDKFDKAETALPIISEFLGHKSSKSGTFLYKIAAFRAYGLADGRGKIAVTDVGENIAFKKDEVSYNEALIRAVTKVPFWKFLFDKYTKSNKDIKEDDFWLDLKEQYDLTIDEAKDLAPEILKSYHKDTRLINMSLLLEKKELPITNESPKPSGVDNIDKQNEDMLVISYGKYNVTLPNEFSEREDVGEILKSMIDLSLQQKKTKSSSEESKQKEVKEDTKSAKEIIEEEQEKFDKRTDQSSD